jgi:hypothetical protein
MPWPAGNCPVSQVIRNLRKVSWALIGVLFEEDIDEGAQQDLKVEQ